MYAILSDPTTSVHFSCPCLLARSSKWSSEHFRLAAEQPVERTDDGVVAERLGGWTKDPLGDECVKFDVDAVVFEPGDAIPRSICLCWEDARSVVSTGED